MEDKKTSILLVDDDELSLVLLKTFLEDTEYEIYTASDGLQAWKLLEINPDRFSAVLLDRRMPNMDGMELLKLIKESPKFLNLPVIMQTAADSEEDILEGLLAGAHYYLTKPFDKKTLNSIVETAVNEYRRYRGIKEELNRTAKTLNLMRSGSFAFRTLEEGKNITALLSGVCPNSESVAMGLSELIINAIEHGNLGITYEEKSDLLKNMRWEQEVNERLADPNYKDRHVTIEYLHENDHIEFLISDEGEGFNWNEYLNFNPERAFDAHGRGIAMANNISFSAIEFLDKGNRVRATINFDDES